MRVFTSRVHVYILINYNQNDIYIKSFKFPAVDMNIQPSRGKTYKNGYVLHK